MSIQNQSFLIVENLAIKPLDPNTITFLFFIIGPATETRVALVNYKMQE